MGARQEDLRTAQLLAHVVDIGAHPVAGAEALARQQLVAPEDRLGAAEVDGDIAELDALDEAVHDLADSALVLVELPGALGLAHLLHDHLLGGLRGDPAEIDRRQRIDEELADLRIGLDPTGLVERQLRCFVLDCLDHLAVAGELDVAAHPVDRGANVVLMPVFGATGLLDRHLHGFQDLVALDSLLAGDRVGHLQELESVQQISAAFHRLLVSQISNGVLSAAWRRRRAARRSKPSALSE